MGFAAQILKPEYCFQPRQILRRLARRNAGRPDRAEMTTPWGLPMQVRPREAIGHALWQLGVLDLALTEIVWRLLEPGETAVDIGANIGYVTGLMAARAGSRGEVWAFEPCPDIHDELAGHVARWQAGSKALGGIRIHALALSNHCGRARLFQPADFGANRGTASLEEVSAESGQANSLNAPAVEVLVDTFDTVFPSDRRVGVLKIDVEGHELSVFEGAARALRSGRVRDIVFEEHHGYPSDTGRLLESHGYTLWRIERTFFGPRLLPPAEPAPNSKWLPPNFLASREPERARRLCAPRGWQALRG